MVRHPEDAIPILNPARLGRSPTCVIVVGMAGSGKTTLVAQLQRSLADGSEDALSSEVGGEAAAEGTSDAAATENSATGTKDTAGGDGSTDEKCRPAGYLLNLDPAAKVVPYGASIDIRDTVDYHQVMMQHKLGPNGAILTCLNLFATRFDQVMSILERRAFGEHSNSNKEDVHVHSFSPPPVQDGRVKARAKYEHRSLSALHLTSCRLECLLRSM